MLQYTIVMKPVTKDILKTAANKLMFELEDSQYDTLIVELERIIEQMDKIGEIPGIDEEEPMTFPFDVSTSYLREDEPESPLKKDDVLKNAGEIEDDQIRIPKVIK